MDFIIYSIYRNVNYSENNQVRSNRNEDQLNANLRRVTVNAQVTAFLSLFEVTGFIVIGIITLVTSSKDTAKVLFPLLEYILLPAAFLINTEENKLQLVEHGWLNILFNTLNMFTVFNPCKRTNDVIPFDQAET